MARPDGRAPDELRPITFERDFTEMAGGSCLVSFGGTRVLCTASIDDDVPRWMRGKGKGWVTAEYSMLPGSSPERVDREAARGKQSGRTVEIQRLIGRSLRAACDMVLLGERQVVVDCDVLQADGGTRTASICGGFLALHDALARLVAAKSLAAHPLHSYCAAISVGIVGGVPVLDLPYVEDSRAEVDMNVVMLRPIDGGLPRFVEVQGTAEGHGVHTGELDALLELAELGLAEITDLQAEMVAVAPPPAASADRQRDRRWSAPRPTRTRWPRSSSCWPAPSTCCRGRPTCRTWSRTPTRWRATPASRRRPSPPRPARPAVGRRHRARGRPPSTAAPACTRPATPASTPPTPTTGPSCWPSWRRARRQRPPGPLPHRRRRRVARRSGAARRGRVRRDDRVGRAGWAGFGYDPVFVPDDGDGRTFAEMDEADKHAAVPPWAGVQGPAGGCCRRADGRRAPR